MSDNMFAHSTTRGPLTRVATGIGLTLAAIATIGLGAGAAAAAPQQPFAADDPIPGMPGAGSAVNIANSIFGSLSGLMNNVIPGAGDLLMPATSALGGGGGIPRPWRRASRRTAGRARRWTAGRAAAADCRAGCLAVSRVKPPGSAATRAACPVRPGLPGGLPGQTPGYPGGLPGQQFPGQTPGVASYPGSPAPGLAPGQAPGLAGPVAQAPLAGQQGPVSSASANGGTLVHVPVV